MFEARKVSRLWRFFDSSLLSHTEFQVLSKEKEREILLALSQVFRRVELLNQEDDSDSDSDTVKQRSVTRLGCEEIDCLSKIIFNLVYLLTFDSQYIQHLAGNVLLAISEFVVENKCYWEAFIQSLCVCLDFGVNILLTCSSTASLLGTEDSNKKFLLALKDKLKSGNWSVVNGLVRVLRYVLKNLTQNHDTHITSLYFDSVNSCLSNLPWNSFDEIFFGATEKKAQNGLSERFVFLGNFIQFLCSLVVDSHRALSLIIVLVPKVVHWCLSNQGFCVDKCTLQYFKHKLLVLMIRLEAQTSLDCSVLISWLELLKQYFGEDLRRPIKSLKPVQNESLEGSPFLSCLYDDEVNSSSSMHVQRRVIFLLLRCSFGLINYESDPNEKCGCLTRTDATEELDCCARKSGLLELNNWLRLHFSTDVFPSELNYYRKCKEFTFDFLKLYIPEDDLLFRMLLLLLCQPIPSRKEYEKDNVACQDAKFDVLFHTSNLLNTVHLFHLFLSELHYDHQVLLDYLISKDTGILCAEYLLRCLRVVVCDSWQLFIKFSVVQNSENQLYHNKRKYTCVDQDFKLNESSMPSETNEVLTLLEKSYYKEAKECLISLLISIENLHGKKLFPYNPKVLLERLRTFQELCYKEKRHSRLDH